MQIRYIHRDYLRERLTRLALFETPIIVLAIICFTGAIEMPNSNEIGIGILFAVTVFGGLHVRKIFTRYKCEECGAMLKGSISKGFVCEKCQITYRLEDPK